MSKKISVFLFFLLCGMICSATGLSFKYPLTTTQKKYSPPALSEKGAWTMVIVPDTQSYVKNRRNHPICNTIFKWIADNLKTMNIQMVLHTGDLVELNDSDKIHPPAYDCTSKEQWRTISDIFKHLDGKVPYVLCTGNHDYGKCDSEDRRTKLNKYFPVRRNHKNSAILIELGKNTFGRETVENAAYRFTAPNGQKILIVSLQFSPTDKQLQWAQKVFARPEYKDHFGILLTHAYLYPMGHIFTDVPHGGSNGRKIFQELVQPSNNIKLVVCGHFSLPDNWLASAAFFKRQRKDGGKVYEMLFNPQAIGGGWHGSGGDGWIRLLEFSADMKKIKVRTFSPYFAQSPGTSRNAWHTAPFNEFDIDISGR